MPTLNLTDEQVTELVRQLSPERRREVLMTLCEQGASTREGRMIKAEEQLRKVATDRGCDWDGMSNAERELFVDDLVHEDRGCR